MSGLYLIHRNKESTPRHTGLVGEPTPLEKWLQKSPYEIRNMTAFDIQRMKKELNLEEQFYVVEQSMRRESELYGVDPDEFLEEFYLRVAANIEKDKRYGKLK